jgi:hypothetical protein
VHVDDAAAWLTVKSLPAIVRVPLREVAAVLAATVYEETPLPLPVVLAVIQETLLDELQAQPAVAVTLTLPLPPAALNDALVAESVYVHVDEPAAWLTVKSLPAIVRVPLRVVVAVLAATT